MSGKTFNKFCLFSHYPCWYNYTYSLYFQLLTVILQENAQTQAAQPDMCVHMFMVSPDTQEGTASDKHLHICVC